MKRLLTLLLLCSAVAWGNPDNPGELDVGEYAQESPDLLALPDELLPQLEELRKIRGVENRLLALHHLLFDEDHFDIRYDGRHTFTAAQAFHYKRGNCLALSSLFIAAARYINIDAYYQTVEIPATWEQRESFLVVPGHINAGVANYNTKFDVEFLAVLADTVDIPKHVRRISDKRVLAEYHNNIGFEYLDSGNVEVGEWHLTKATELAPDLDFLWSNLGVLSMWRGDYDAAIQFYRRALELNRNNPTTLSNMYFLYTEQGKTKKAAMIAKKVRHSNRKNPYYFGRLAEDEIRAGEYDEAIKNLKRAIRINQDIPQLHHLLGLSYFYKHDYVRSEAALKDAQRLASPEENDRYDKKLQLLASYTGKNSR